MPNYKTFCRTVLGAAVVSLLGSQQADRHAGALTGQKGVLLQDETPAIPSSRAGKSRGQKVLPYVSPPHVLSQLISLMISTSWLKNCANPPYGNLLFFIFGNLMLEVFYVLSLDCPPLL